MSNEPNYHAVLELHKGNKAEAARALGIPRSTLYDKLDAENRAGATCEPDLTMPDLPEGDIPIEEVIDQLTSRFERRNELAQAKKWAPVRVHDDKPIGVLWFGDPHIDDNGCHWPKLRRDVELCRTTEGLYGANIGDSANNWSGRLSRLYANQDTSKETARELVRWFMFKGGVRWLVWLLGNHDLWNPGELREMGASAIWLEDWEAQFRLVFPSGREARVWASHNFKGSSIWNKAHGNQRAAFMRSRAHLYVSGHLHEWFLAQNENPDRGHVYWLAAARGYKFLDQYAKTGGFPEHQHGSSILSVFDPASTSETGFVSCFADAEEGADFLRWKRDRA